MRTAGRYGGALAGIVVVDTPVYEGPPPPQMAAPEMGFGVGRTYPTREAVLARFRLVPEQPVLPYVREHVAGWSVTAREGGEWGWKFDQALFVKMDPPSQSPMVATEPAGCRAAILHAQHGMMSRDMARRLGGRLGPAVPVAELPAAGHHVMLDEPLCLVTALRAVLAGWAT
jgi:pimeloyl-ACP methyl ester carboxylesterase